MVQPDGMFRSILYSKLKEKKISTKKAVFVLNSARIASRDIELPLVKEKQLKEMIAMNASDYFPVDLSQYKLVHQIIEKIDRPEEKKLRLSVIAVPNDLILSYGSGMMHGYMPFNAAGELLVPFRTWRNTQTSEACKKLIPVFNFNIPQRWSIAHLYQAILSGEDHVKDIAFFTTLAGYIHWKLSGQCRNTNKFFCHTKISP